MRGGSQTKGGKARALTAFTGPNEGVICDKFYISVNELSRETSS